MKKSNTYLYFLVFLMLFSSCLDDFGRNREAFGPFDVDGMAEFFDAQGLTYFAQYYRMSGGNFYEEDFEGGITIFAPSDEAFMQAMELYGSPDLDDFVAKRGGIAHLSMLIGSHIFHGEFYGYLLDTTGVIFNPYTENFLHIKKGKFAGNRVIHSQPDFVEKDILLPYGNGVMHIIDGVFLPSYKNREKNFVEAFLDLGIHGFLSALVYEETLLEKLMSGPQFSLITPHDNAIKEFLATQQVRSFREFKDKLGGRDHLREYLSQYIIVESLNHEDILRPKEYFFLNGEPCLVKWENHRFYIRNENGQTVWSILHDTTNNGTLLVVNDVFGE
ncbi:fasciclin domain-containing protein [Pleomorphovibrio marinus]|uniref:fasciclin domain-containing protein n=1 Tax=Pleomorphovibrio marinus TaxID=2164132 RepID=UPI000E0B316A|nr:fasciclin domain-containing protein [Pleomorphovibrio marinus]